MSTPRAQIGFEQTGLAGVLKDNRLEVPLNQREYSWTDAEVTRLFQDLGKAIQEGGDYFLGTIVTIPRQQNDVLEVVDGQQRLATAAIFLVAVRDYLRDKGDEPMIVKSIDDDFLRTIDREKRQGIARLKLNVDDNDVFNRIINRKPNEPMPVATRESHRRMLSAYQQSTTQVSRIVALGGRNAHGDALNPWIGYLQHNALVVLLKVPAGADAYKMFETLNDRGLRTSQVDLIKSHLFGRAGSREAEVQTKWAYVRGTLEALDEDDSAIGFIRHAIISQRGHVTASALYETVESMVKGEQAAVTFSATLEELASVYVAIANPEHERWNGLSDAVRRSIEVFNILQIRPLRPLLLAIAARSPDREITGAFQHVISLGVRTLIAASTRSNSFEEPIATAAKRITSGEIQTTRDLAKELAGITSTDGQFRAAFATTRVSNARLARYYLRSLEMQANQESEPWFVPQEDREFINLEHVLPRKPEGNWPVFSDDDVALYGTRLGNLALMRTSDNSTLKSDKFETKREVYTRSPYVLTREVGATTDWTPTAINDRQQRLADLAIQAWPI